MSKSKLPNERAVHCMADAEYWLRPSKPMRPRISRFPRECRLKQKQADFTRGRRASCVGDRCVQTLLPKDLARVTVDTTVQPRTSLPDRCEAFARRDQGADAPGSAGSSATSGARSQATRT